MNSFLSVVLMVGAVFSAIYGLLLPISIEKVYWLVAMFGLGILSELRRLQK